MRDGQVVPGHRRVDVLDLPARGAQPGAQLGLLAGLERRIEAADRGQRRAAHQHVAAEVQRAPHRVDPVEIEHAGVAATARASTRGGGPRRRTAAASASAASARRTKSGCELGVAVEEQDELAARRAASRGCAPWRRRARRRRARSTVRARRRPRAPRCRRWSASPRRSARSGTPPQSRRRTDARQRASRSPSLRPMTTTETSTRPRPWSSHARRPRSCTHSAQLFEPEAEGQHRHRRRDLPHHVAEVGEAAVRHEDHVAVLQRVVDGARRVDQRRRSR